MSRFSILRWSITRGPVDLHHPSVTRSLSIEARVTGREAALVGLGHPVRAVADVRLS